MWKTENFEKKSNCARDHYQTNLVAFSPQFWGGCAIWSHDPVFFEKFGKLGISKNNVILCLKSLPNRFGSIFPQIGGGVCHMVAFSNYFWINWKNKHFWEFWYFMLWMPQQPSWGLSHGSWGRGPDFRISLSAPPPYKRGGCNYFYSRSV